MCSYMSTFICIGKNPQTISACSRAKKVAQLDDSLVNTKCRPRILMLMLFTPAFDTICVCSLESFPALFEEPSSWWSSLTCRHGAFHCHPRCLADPATPTTLPRKHCTHCLYDTTTHRDVGCLRGCGFAASICVHFKAVLNMLVHCAVIEIIEQQIIRITIKQ